MSKRILAVVDSSRQLQQWENFLMNGGFTAMVVVDPHWALQSLVEFKPDIVFFEFLRWDPNRWAIVERFRLSAPTLPITVGLSPQIEQKFIPLKDNNSIAVFNLSDSLPSTLTKLKKSLKQFKTKPCIIIVDDDPTLLRLLESRLMQSGYDVVTVLNSEEAMHIIRDEEPDLVITDIMMPNVDGWKITHDLKSNPQYKSLPVIIMSSIINKEGPPSQFEIGDFFLAKPPLIDQLMTTVKQLLDKNCPK